MITLVKVVQTCCSVPSQWNAWDADGNYYYLRYRFGHATVSHFDSPDWETWPATVLGDVAEWMSPERLELGNRCYDGTIGLGRFCEVTGIQLAPDAKISPCRTCEEIHR